MRKLKTIKKGSKLSVFYSSSGCALSIEHCSRSKGEHLVVLVMNHTLLISTHFRSSLFTDGNVPLYSMQFIRWNVQLKMTYLNTEEGHLRIQY